MFMTDKNEVIDLHCHTAGIGAGNSGCHISPALVGSWKFRFYLKAFGVTETEVIASGDGLIIERLAERLAEAEHVGKAVILALDGAVSSDGELDISKTEMLVPGEFVAREVRKHENLLYGASINPYRKDALDRLEQAASDQAVLLKWLPNIQLIDPADKRIIPFYERMRELGLPLLTHTGHEYSFTQAQNELADPERLRLPLELGVTVIAAHAATAGTNQGMKNLDRILPMFRQFPNLYADISSLTQINRLGLLEKVLAHQEIHEQLLYGTDMPLLETGIVSPWFFVHTIGFKACWRIWNLKNPWDQDVRLKSAQGVPQSLFVRASQVLRDNGRLAGNSTSINA